MTLFWFTEKGTHALHHCCLENKSCCFLPAIAGHKQTSALPFGDRGLRVFERMPIEFLLLLLLKKQNNPLQKNASPTFTSKFTLQDGWKAGNKMHTELTSAVNSLINPSKWMEAAAADFCLHLIQLSPLLPCSIILGIKFSYNKTFTASLPGIILILLTIRLGKKPENLAGIISEGILLNKGSMNAITVTSLS